MNISYSELGELSRTVCSSLSAFRNRRHYNPDQLRQAYRVLSVGRYLSDPVAYAGDHRAVSDSARFLEIFGSSPHDLQVRLTSTRITVDMALKGEIVDTVPAMDFFETVAEACSREPVEAPSVIHA